MESETISAIGKVVNETLKTNLAEFHIGLYSIAALLLLNIILGFILRLLEKRQDMRASITIARRAEQDLVVKSIYNDVNKLRTDLTDHSNAEDSLNERVRVLRARIRSEDIAMSDSATKNFNELLDLISIACIDRSSRDFAAETQIVKKIKKEFRSY